MTISLHCNIVYIIDDARKDRANPVFCRNMASTGSAGVAKGVRMDNAR